MSLSCFINKVRLPRTFAACVHALAFVMLGSITCATAAAPVVTTTIRPLQLIAAAITQGVLEPELVWAQGQDPHHVALRPSERRKLGNADIVLWVGPMLEKPLAELAADLAGELLTVQNLAGLSLLTSGGELDPHVWLDTANARVIAAALTALLSKQDAANAAHYEGNAQQFHAALDALDAHITAALAPNAQQGWAVYHHSLHYFAEQFALPAPLTLADSHNNPPGIRSVLALRAQLQQKQLACMLTEPGVNHAELRSLLDGEPLEILSADVLGYQLPADASYVDLMQGIAAVVAECLGAAR